jgi:excisionase family DNA binding protein
MMSCIETKATTGGIQMNSPKGNRMCMTVPEVAEAMGISRPTAYTLANREDFPAIRLGKRIVVPREAFETWLHETVAQGRHDISI